ncbi:hypothetical protein Pmani_017422 [Petrolisthes manimaculis]|uniref:Bestrophin homolog n=1 Tax=Petrolisthes manimaculis TaxID=1843537 RepID=A0AAE1U5T6_9EUCA|nr:hypothetical protein Pmani_017422 [Petrolisthes manimaculis]
MPVEYTKAVGDTHCCVFGRLLFRWRGSVYKLLWRDLLVYAVLYASLSCLYRFYLKDDHRKVFEEVVLHSMRYRDLIPVSFILGFYVTLVVGRWWASCHALPDNADVALLLATAMTGKDIRSFELRSRVVRYVNLTYVLLFRHVSAAVHHRYPDVQSLVNDRFLTEREKEALEEAETRGCQDTKWLPMSWCCQLVQAAREEGYIDCEGDKNALVNALVTLRGQCGRLLAWHHYNIPLVYTQVVTIAVYTYFIFSLVSEQYLDESRHYPRYEADLVVPLFAFLELIFYLGLLKVAEALINPFGIDDHSFPFLNILEDARYSAFVISHTRYGEKPPTAHWRPGEEGRLSIMEVGRLPGPEPREDSSLESS